MKHACQLAAGYLALATLQFRALWTKRNVLPEEWNSGVVNPALQDFLYCKSNPLQAENPTLQDSFFRNIKKNL